MEKTMIVSKEDLQSFGCDELADWLSDYISDKMGYCHKGFDFEIKVKNIEWDLS